MAFAAGDMLAAEFLTLLAMAFIPGGRAMKSLSDAADVAAVARRNGDDVAGTVSTVAHRVDDGEQVIHGPARAPGAGGHLDAPALSPQTQEKILMGERKLDVAGNPTKKMIGGHSPRILRHDDYEVTSMGSLNIDGTRSVKYSVHYPDGVITIPKRTALFPESWSDSKIIDSITEISTMPPWGVRYHDRAVNYIEVIDGVRIQVIANDGAITAGYPLGGNGPPSDFIQIIY